MVSRYGSPLPRFGNTSMTVVVLAGLVIPIVLVLITGHASDLIAISPVFGTMSFPFAVFLFVLAQHLYKKTLRVREFVLRDEDRKDRAQVISAVNVCQELIQGILNRNTGHYDSFGMLAIRHIAETISLIRAQNDHLLGKTGIILAERIRDIALATLRGGSPCTTATFSFMRDSLQNLGGYVLPIDDPELVRRREYMSSTWGSEFK